MASFENNLSYEELLAENLSLKNMILQVWKYNKNTLKLQKNWI